MAREVVQLQPGVPEMISLKFAEGRNYGERVMFSTTDDRILYLDNSEALELARLGIQKETPFQITKLGVGKGARHKFASLNGAGRTSDAPVPNSNNTYTSPNGNNNGHAAPPAPSITPTHAKFLAAYMVAIDIIAEARVYAGRKNLPVDVVTFGDVRALAATIVIDQQGHGGAR